MLVELFIFYQLLAVVLFGIAFFTHNEILWVLTAILSGILMFSSYDIQAHVYVANVTVGYYVPVVQSYSYPYLMGINLIFFGLSLILGLFDMFDKYGGSFQNKE